MTKTKETLIFNEEEHTYHVGQLELTSVTKFVSWFFPEFDKEEISRRVASNRGITQEEVLDEWNEVADKGTLVHKEIEDYLHGKVSITSPKSFWGCFVAESTRSELEGVKLTSELRVHSEKLGLAGTIDFISQLGDSTVFIDWKTNEKLTEHGYGMGVKESTKDIPNSKLHKYYLQLNVYKYIYEKERLGEVRDMWVVHLKEDGAKGFKVPDMQGDVRNMIEEWGNKEDA